MMGSKARSFDPIDGLTLADLVPADHFYRHLERALDLSFVRGLVADCYAAGGRPSIGPCRLLQAATRHVLRGDSFRASAHGARG